MPFHVVGTESGNSLLSIPDDLRFLTIQDRDDFFTTNPSRLFENIVCTVYIDVNKVQLYEYINGEWVGVSDYIKGDKGDRGFDVIYQYGNTEFGPWSNIFDKDLRQWARISEDSGASFKQAFRFVAQDGLSFIAQYSSSEFGPWSTSFHDGVHDYVRFSNDNQNTWTPAQRFKAVPFGINVDDKNIIDLGGHKIISNNENMAFKNILTGVNFYPLWQGISNDGQNIYRATEIMFGQRQNGVSINGNIDLSKTVNYDFTREYPNRVAALGMVSKSAESYTGDIKYQIWSQGGLNLIYSNTIKNTQLSVGQDFSILFQGNLFLQPGNILNIKIIKSDNTPILVYAGSIDDSMPWRTLDVIPYELAQVINRNDGDVVARMIESLQSDNRLSVNSLKDLDDIRIGTIRGDIDFNLGLVQFVPATKNDYWKSDREIVYGDIQLNSGDRLYAKRNILVGETIGTLADASTFYIERNIANIAKPEAVGLVKPAYNTIVSTSGELSVRQATATDDGVVKLGTPGGAAKLGEDGKIDIEQLPQIDTMRRVSVVDESSRLALPVSNKFTIAIQIDTNDQWYIDAFELPSVSANWVYGGSVAVGVNSFNGRSGIVSPTSGDYTPEMVGSVPKPINDGKRRVFIGDTLIEETKISDIITDDSTNKLYKIGIDSGIPYFTEIN